jgi:ribosome biogenesis GTPase
MSATAFKARVVAAHGRSCRVMDEAGTVTLARPARRELQVVCGDDVDCEHNAQHDELRIVAVLPRRTLLARTDSRGRREPLAANLSLLVVVIAPAPAPDFFIVDRYLAAAACLGMHGCVLANKQDLGYDAALETELAAYKQIGYPLLRCCTRSSTGLAELTEHLRGETAILVGQSGAGKSSLLRQLLPDRGETEIAVGELDRGDEGRHTTTTAVLFDLPSGGSLIDSPGVRDFAPALQDLEPATLGFIDVARLAPQCRFQDCRHMAEPGCAVRAAVENGALYARRYESYRRLRRLYERLGERH